MREARLKKQIFYFLIIAKIMVIAWIWLQWDTGGFSQKQMINAVAMVLPLFSVYASAMFSEYVQNRRMPTVPIDKSKQPKVTKTFRNITYFVFLIYVSLIFYVIGLKPQGKIEFAEMGTWIASIESGFGIYLGQIVFGLFGKEKQNPPSSK